MNEQTDRANRTVRSIPSDPNGPVAGNAEAAMPGSAGFVGVPASICVNDHVHGRTEANAGNSLDDMESRIMRAMATRANAPLPGNVVHNPGDGGTIAPDTTLANVIVDSPMQREQAIAAAVAAGVPKRVTLWSTLVEARSSLRLRDLFFGAWDCVAVALVMTATVWLIPLIRLFTNAAYALAHPGTVYTMAFLTAPFLYEATHLLVRFKEHESHTDDLLRTMRWSFTRLCALRMLVMGAAAATLIVGYAAVVSVLGAQVGLASGGAGGSIGSGVGGIGSGVGGGVGGALSFPDATGIGLGSGAANAGMAWSPAGLSGVIPDTSAARFSLLTLLGVAFSALFVFGIAQLVADVHARWPWSMIAIPALWVALCVALLAWHDVLAPLLAGLPPMVALITAVATGVAYFAAMGRFVRLAPSVAEAA
ncbi:MULTISPECIES: hypothetical protein [unclassified Bifidobacterium]|uniref:hypothetical protein n=1 Tax=unclassified Bifidobacterium TaxID=2608897 RepID=UPI001129E62A|nr:MULTISPECIES: hypothetical protein [unclassified Bifidobacterium]TPF77779.1 hypothetical protein BW09_08065 [Bifidobacterium sp. UTCIF-1]TPF80266.1 hypothetical protein BW08_05770 [Bifidobacterium sp. UTCIF-24]TPF82951.1 hypothetical protein BW12_01875 [Bifidobacterium sp. UTCIF-3]TPF84176.1 hypothetical protein BW07_05855 [Bifidobacterium sp. UTCIF-36]TPF90708.1 hypothetical protein BW10_02300 [Bifidobacterium sp. UTBIF-56]